MQRVVIALCFFVLLPSARADDVIDREMANLERLKTRFVEERERARTIIVRKFDAMIVDLKNAKGIREEERLGRVKKWQEEKEAFTATDELPLQADLVELGLAYGIKVSEAYAPVAQKYNDLMKQALNKKQDAWLETLRTDKAGFDNLNLPGRRQFTEGSSWFGTAFPIKEGDSAKEYGWRVTDLTGDAFDGIADFDIPAAGHPVYETSGSLEGIRVRGRYDKALRGVNYDLAFEGVVLGRTLFLSARFVNSKKQTVQQFVAMRRR
jgi:hypothetical protein